MMREQPRRPGGFRRASAGIGLAALLAVGVPAGASALWSATASASLTVQGAAVGASSAAPALVSTSLEESEPVTGRIELAFPVSATSGSAPWTAAAAAVTGTGAVGTTGATLAVAGYAVTAAGCTGADYASDPALPGLAGLADGQSRTVCLALDATGLTAASNGATATIGLTVTAAVGPASVDGTGWTVAAPVQSFTVALPIVAEPSPEELTCESDGGTSIIIGVDLPEPDRIALYLDTSDDPFLTVYPESPDSLSLPVVFFSGVAEGLHTVRLGGFDGTEWGWVTVSYVSGPDPAIFCGEVN